MKPWLLFATIVWISPALAVTPKANLSPSPQACAKLLSDRTHQELIRRLQFAITEAQLTHESLAEWILWLEKRLSTFNPHSQPLSLPLFQNENALDFYDHVQATDALLQNPNLDFSDLIAELKALLQQMQARNRSVEESKDRTTIVETPMVLGNIWPDQKFGADVTNTRLYDGSIVYDLQIDGTHYYLDPYDQNRLKPFSIDSKKESETKKFLLSDSSLIYPNEIRSDAESIAANETDPFRKQIIEAVQRYKIEVGAQISKAAGVAVEPGVSLLAQWTIDNKVHLAVFAVAFVNDRRFYVYSLLPLNPKTEILPVAAFDQIKTSFNYEISHTSLVLLQVEIDGQNFGIWTYKFGFIIIDLKDGSVVAKIEDKTKSGWALNLKILKNEDQIFIVLSTPSDLQIYDLKSFISDKPSLEKLPLLDRSNTDYKRRIVQFKNRTEKAYLIENSSWTEFELSRQGILSLHSLLNTRATEDMQNHAPLDIEVTNGIDAFSFGSSNYVLGRKRLHNGYSLVLINLTEGHWRSADLMESSNGWFNLHTIVVRDDFVLTLFVTSEKKVILVQLIGPENAQLKDYLEPLADPRQSFSNLEAQ